MASDSATIDKSVLLRQWLWPLRLAFWTSLVGICLWATGMLSQAAWAYHRAPQDPVGYQLEQLEAELDGLAKLSPAWIRPMSVAQTIGDSIYGFAEATAALFSRTLMNVPGKTRKLSSSAFIREEADAGGTYARELVRTKDERWQALVLGSYAFAVRSAAYLAMAPVLLLACGLGLVDGLVLRARRKANAGRESSSLYHRAKLGFTFVLITGYLAFLVWPEVPHPAVPLLGTAIVGALLLRLQAVYYKKYL